MPDEFTLSNAVLPVTREGMTLKVRGGIAGGMSDILEAQVRAARAITP